MDFFISHHEIAIRMADQVIARGESDEVRTMAERMRRVQTTERDTLRSIRAELAGSPEPPAMPEDRHMDPEMGSMMDASGSALDRMFLIEMIPHHAAGLPVADCAEPHVENTTLRMLADDMFHAQAKEIGEMHDLLEAIPETM